MTISDHPASCLVSDPVAAVSDSVESLSTSSRSPLLHLRDALAVAQLLRGTSRDATQFLEEAFTRWLSSRAAASRQG